MTVHISLPPDMEVRLQQRAQAAGKDVPTWVREAVEEKLATESSETQAVRTSQQWEAEFDVWIANHKPVSHFVDDSRDSIYADRGQ